MALPTSQQPRPRQGRPVATSHEEIERVAFRLFTEHGFEQTTLTEIAAAVGVGRRTLFHYYSSKNDIPWGQFDATLAGFRELLAMMPESLPLPEAICRGVMAFNDFPASAEPSHEARMRLILGTPALQAHAAVRYTAWRQVVAEFVAARLGTDPTDPLSSMVGHVSLALALAAYEEWMRIPDSQLPELVRAHFDRLGFFFAST